MDDFLQKYTGQQVASVPTNTQASNGSLDGFLSKYAPGESTNASSGQPNQSALPDDVVTASQRIGDQSDNGLCQAFVEEVQGSKQKYPSAADAWNSQLSKARGSLAGIKPGDAIYFAPDQSNGGFGHTAIYKGNGKIVSATYNGVQESNLDSWVSQTGQRILGYIPYGGKK